MKLFKKNENKKTTKLPMTGKVKKGFPDYRSQQSVRFHFRSGEGCWYDYARLWYRADWSFPQIP